MSRQHLSNFFRSGLKGSLADLTRSELMSRIRGKGNKSTELRLVAVFRAARMTGWRRHASLVGRPDFVFPEIKLAVFVDGCFWHGCPIHFKRPKSNKEFWTKKIERNKARDRKIARELRMLGWRVLRIWEHSLRAKEIPKLTRRLRRQLEV